MRTKSVLNTAIAAGIFVSSLALAAPVSTKNVTVARDVWLKQLKRIAPTIICHGFTHDNDVNKKLIKAKINYEQCLALIPAVFDTCQGKYYSMIPAVLKNDIIAQWGGVLGNCIGVEFAEKYFTKTAVPDVMAKEAWLGKFVSAGPALMCTELFKNTSVREKLDKHQIDYHKCLTLLPDSIRQCQSKLMATIPATLNESGRKEWGERLSTCVGKDFGSQHLH